MYKNIFGLSCIENHVIFQLRKADIDDRSLYFDSIISSKIIYHDLLENNVSAFDYQRAPRIHNHCKQLGLLTLKKHSFDGEFHPDVGKTYLMRITPEFNKGVIRSRAFRPDHYVILEKHHDNLFSLQNDIPETHLIISNDKLQEAYDGDYFVLEINRSLSFVEEENLVQQGIRNFFSWGRNFDPINELVEKPISATQMRDFLYLTKQLRNRFKQFLEKRIDVLKISDILTSYEKVLTYFEYSRLRKMDITHAAHECISQINTLDIAFYQIAKEMLKNDC